MSSFEPSGMRGRRRRRALPGLLALAALLIGSAATSGCDVFPAIGPLEEATFSPRWATRLYALEMLAYEPEEWASPLIVRPKAGPPHGLVVVPSKDRTVRGLHAGTGAVQWTFRTEGPNTTAAVPVDGGEHVLVASLDGRVYRLDARTGEPAWISDLPGRVGAGSAPAVVGDKVFVAAIDNRLIALSLADGKRVWDRRRPHPSDMTVSGQGGAAGLGTETVVAGFSDGKLVAYAAQDGATLWDQDLSGGQTDRVDVDSTPLVLTGQGADGDATHLIVSSYRVGLFALDAETGDVVWLLRGEGFGTPAEGGGILYAPLARGGLVAVDARRGEVLWRARVGGGVAATPTLTGKWVLAPLRDGLYVLDRATGVAVDRFDGLYGVSATPAYDRAAGLAVVLTNAGDVVALDAL